MLQRQIRRAFCYDGIVLLRVEARNWRGRGCDGDHLQRGRRPMEPTGVSRQQRGRRPAVTSSATWTSGELAYVFRNKGLLGMNSTCCFFSSEAVRKEGIVRLGNTQWFPGTSAPEISPLIRPYLLVFDLVNFCISTLPVPAVQV